MASVMESTGEVPVPPQWKPQPVTDFRGLVDGPRGYKVEVTKKGRLGSKRKLDEYSEQVEAEAEDVSEKAAVDWAPTKKARQDIAGLAKVSGRPWKFPGERAGTLKNPKLSTSWEKKMRDKADMKAFRERKQLAREAHGELKKQARERREAAKERKEENRRKSEVTVRVSADTARRMAKSKKDRKKLRAGGAGGTAA